MEGAEAPLPFLRFMLCSHKGNNAAMGPIDAGENGCPDDNDERDQ